MRITDNIRFNTTIYNLLQTKNQYGDISEKIATQKKVNRSSDDPVAATQIMNLRQGKALNAQFTQNLDFSSSWIKATETTLSSVYDLLNIADGIAKGNTGTNPADRRNATGSIQAIINSVRGLANSKWGDRYLFSGSREAVVPFPVEPPVPSVQAGRNNGFDGTAVASGSYIGTDNATYAVKIMTGGTLATATYQFSTNGGQTWNAANDTIGTVVGDKINTTGAVPGPITGATSIAAITGYAAVATDYIQLEGTDTDGNPVSVSTPLLSVLTTIDGLLGEIEAAFGDVSASISAGKLIVSTNGANPLAVNISVKNAVGTNNTLTFDTDSNLAMSTDGGVAYLGDGIGLTFDASNGETFNANDIFYLNAAAPLGARIEPAVAAADNAYSGDFASIGSYTGTTNKTYVVKIVEGGALGTATYRVSEDGGRTWDPPITDQPDKTLASGLITLGSDGVSLVLDDTVGTTDLGANDIFYVNAFAPGRYQGNNENLTINIDRGTSIDYSLSGAEVFTAEGAKSVDALDILNNLKDALASDAIANTAGGNAITSATLISAIEGYAYDPTDYIYLTGTDTDGNEVSVAIPTFADISDPTRPSITVGTFLDKIATEFGDVSASISSEGKITVTDNTTGTSRLKVGITVRNADNSVDDTLKFNEDGVFIMDQQKINSTISSILQELQDAKEQIRLSQSQCGIKTAHIDVVKNNVKVFSNSLDALLGNAQDADITNLAAQLSMKELALQTSYAMAAKLSDLSILNFLK